MEVLSKKRFTRRGFKGHRVNPASRVGLAKAGDPILSNYVRHQMSKANKAVKEEKM